MLNDILKMNYHIRAVHYEKALVHYAKLDFTEAQFHIKQTLVSKNDNKYYQELAGQLNYMLDDTHTIRHMNATSLQTIFTMAPSLSLSELGIRPIQLSQNLDEFNGPF